MTNLNAESLEIKIAVYSMANVFAHPPVFGRVIWRWAKLGFGVQML